MKCPACQETLENSAKFCLKCGQRIPRCPTCGEPVLVRSKFCAKDGTRLSQEVLDLLPGGPVKEPAVSADASGKSAAGTDARKPETGAGTPPQKTSTCISCGAPCPEGRKLCPACAARVRREREESIKKPLTKYCAKCGKPIEEGRTLCDACSTGRKSGSKTVVIIVAAVIIFLLAIVACVIAMSGKNGMNGADEKDTLWEMPTHSSWFADDHDDEEDVSFEEVFGAYVMGTEPAETVAPATEAQTEPPTQPPTEPPTEAPTEAPTEPEANEDERVLYFLNYCDSRYLTYSDVEGFDEDMCRIARNGIYARSGRKFKDSALQAYYEQYDWYYPTVDPSAFTAGMLNEYQNANLNLIMNYEREHGYR